MGTNACEKAPSAKSRLNKFGILNATKNASVKPEAPKARAINSSRNKPVMRESMVMPEMVNSVLSKFMLRHYSAQL